MATTGTRLVLPALGSVYAALEPLGYAMMRIASGAAMATFGWQKLFGGGMARDVAEFQHLGLEPAAALATFTSALEFFGGLMIAAGLLTRPVAAMFVVELAVILVKVMLPRAAGYQLSLVWFGVFLYILVRGGGRLSADRLFGREF